MVLRHERALSHWWSDGGPGLTSDTSWRLAGIGDLNGDGRDDVLVRHTSGLWWYYAMNGRYPIGGATGGPGLTSDTSWRLAGIGDLNGDGRDDVLVRHTSGIWWYYAMNGRNPIGGATGGAALTSDTKVGDSTFRGAAAKRPRVHARPSVAYRLIQ